MTVLEFDTASRQPSQPPTAIPDFLQERTFQVFGLVCPNIAELELPQLQRADRVVQAMASALQGRDPEAFNEARRELLQLLKKHGQPIAQWSPLVLELADPNLLRGAHLPQIDLGMTRLQSPFGTVSLEGACLQDANFLCADLGGVSMPEADLSGADLRFAGLQEADLSRALLVGAKLGNARLVETILTGANLYCANLAGAVLKQAVLDEANLRKSDLRQADCQQSSLRYTRLQQADLREANFLMADLTGAKLRQADLRKTYLAFAKLRESRFQQACLPGADFTGADLTLADFQCCRLAGVQFGRAMLAGTTFKRAELQGLDLSTCLDFETASLHKAQFDETTIFPRAFRPTSHEMRAVPFTGLRRLVCNLRKLAGFQRPVPASPTAFQSVSQAGRQ